MDHRPMRSCLPHVLICLLAACCALTGCQRSAGFDVRIEGLKLPPEYAAFVDVSNFAGNVQVRSGERVNEVAVRARARWIGGRRPMNFEDLRKSVAVRAIVSEEDGRRVLRITGKPAGDAPVALDLQIRVPRVSGARVFNTGGEVEMVGISGPVSVENGRPGKSGGNVEVRTGMPMTEPVRIVTTEGKVVYQIGPGSTGDFELITPAGTPEVEAKIGTIDGIRYAGDRWRGSLDKGTNRVEIRSDKGDIRVLLLQNAGEYGKERWDGWPKWPSSPSWIAKLGGE